MTKIDVTTGLPVLPEGLFWRIRDLGATRSYFPNDREIAVEIMKTNTTTSTVTEKVKHKGTWKTLWFSYTREEKRTVTTPENETIVSRSLADYELVDPKSVGSMDSKWKRSNRDYLQLGSIFFDAHDSDKILYVQVFEPTKELILLAAENALAQLNKNAEKARRLKEKAEARKAFLGDYPPKNLEEV